MNQNLLLPTTLLASSVLGVYGGATAHAYACVFKASEQENLIINAETKKMQCMNKGANSVTIDTSNHEKGVICQDLGVVDADSTGRCFLDASLLSVSFVIKDSVYSANIVTKWGTNLFGGYNVHRDDDGKNENDYIKICPDKSMCDIDTRAGFDWDRDSQGIYFIYEPPLDSTLETPVSHNSPAADAEL